MKGKKGKSKGPPAPRGKSKGVLAYFTGGKGSREAAQPLGSLLDVFRCPVCVMPLVARMTSGGPAMVCRCNFPGEFFAGDTGNEVITPGLEEPPPDRLAKTAEEFLDLKIAREAARVRNSPAKDAGFWGSRAGKRLKLLGLDGEEGD